MKLVFNPRPDITVLELAQVFKAISFHSPLILAEGMKIPPELARHLDEQSDIVRIGGHDFIDGAIQCAHCGTPRASIDAGTAPSCPKVVHGASVCIPDGKDHQRKATQFDNFHHILRDETACTHCGTLLEDCASMPCPEYYSL